MEEPTQLCGAETEVQKLKELFNQYNLPNPETLTEEEIRRKLEELSDAVEEIDQQLDKKKTPLPWQDEQRFYDWRSRAESAKWIKENQLKLLKRLLPEINNVAPSARERPVRLEAAVNHPLKVETEEISSTKDETAPGSFVFRRRESRREKNMMEDSLKFYLAKTYELLNTVVKDEGVRLMEDEKDFLRNVERFLIRNKIVK